MTEIERGAYEYQLRRLINARFSCNERHRRLIDVQYLALIRDLVDSGEIFALPAECQLPEMPAYYHQALNKDKLEKITVHVQDELFSLKNATTYSRLDIIARTLEGLEKKINHYLAKHKIEIHFKV